MTEGLELQTISLEMALRHLATEAERAELDKYIEYREFASDWMAAMVYQSKPEYEYGMKYFRIRWQIAERLLEKLRLGDVVATGLELGGEINAQPLPISKYLWRKLELDVDSSEACRKDGEKILVIDILFPENLIYTANSLDRNNFHDSIGSAIIVTFSEEDRTFTVGSETIKLKKIQRAIIRQLFDALKERRGKRLRTAEVLHKAGSKAESISQAFSGSRYWPVLNPLIQREGGECWLLEELEILPGQ
jgi:hypothetical protein